MIKASSSFGVAQIAALSTRLTVGSTRTPTLAMASPFSWPVLVPYALRAPAPVNLGVMQIFVLPTNFKQLTIDSPENKLDSMHISRGDKLKSLVLSQFDSDVRPHVLDYGRRISKSKSEINIFMARKSACFYYCLSKLGLAHSPGIVTTDRILDHDLSWIKGKSISIHDEAVISGSTLAKTKQSLLMAGAKSVEVNAFVVNKKWWAKTLLQPDNEFLEVDDAKCSRVGHSVVRALSLLPRPYSIDYPLLCKVKISEDDLEHIINIPGWSFSNHTSALQAKNDMFVWTLEPDPYVFKDMCRSAGVGYIKDIELLKIRLYGRTEPNQGHGKYHHSFRILPIAILQKKTANEIDQLFNWLINDLKGDNKQILSQSCITGISKLRLIQYYIASKVGEYWSRQFNKQASKALVFAQDEGEISLLFPPHLSKPIANFVLETKENSVIQERSTPKKSNYNSERHLSAEGSITIRHRLIAPFIKKYKEQEIPAREIALKVGPAILTSKDPILTRLEKGFSLNDLLASAGKYPLEHRQRILSNFLDYAIDSGLIVPITVEDSTGVYRAFRHGEEIHLDERAAAIYDAMLREFFLLKANSKPKKIQFEKILILLTRAAIKENLITEWTSSQGAENTAGVRYFLHGAIMQTNQSSLIDYDYDKTFVSYLQRHGVLLEHKGPITLSPTPLSNTLDATELIKAKSIGYSLSNGISRLASVCEDRPVNSLIYITTCLGIRSTALALAAELKYFNRHWGYCRSKILPLSNFKNTNNAPIYMDIDIFKHQKAYLALISAINKLKAYQDNTPIRLLDAIPQKLGRGDELRWRELWPAEVPPESTVFSNTMTDKAKQCGAFSNTLLGLMYIWGYIKRCARIPPINENETSLAVLSTDIQDCLDYELHNPLVGNPIRTNFDIVHNKCSHATSEEHEEHALNLVNEIDIFSSESQKLALDIARESRLHGKSIKTWYYDTAIIISAIAERQNSVDAEDFAERFHKYCMHAVSNCGASLLSSHRGVMMPRVDGDTDSRLLMVPLDARILNDVTRYDFLLVGRGNISSWVSSLCERADSIRVAEITLRACIFLELIGDDRFVSNEESGQPVSVSFPSTFNAVDSALSTDKSSTVSIIAAGRSTKIIREYEESLKNAFLGKHNVWTYLNISNQFSGKNSEGRQLRLRTLKSQKQDHNLKLWYVFITARPDRCGNKDIRSDIEYQKLSNAIGVPRRNIELVPLFGATASSIQDTLSKNNSTFIHISVHGGMNLQLEDEIQQEFSLTPASLAKILNHFCQDLKCLLLLGCNTAKFSEALTPLLSSKPNIIATSTDVSDRQCIQFSESFARAINYNTNASVEDVYDLANIEIVDSPFVFL